VSITWSRRALSQVAITSVALGSAVAWVATANSAGDRLPSVPVTVGDLSRTVSLTGVLLPERRISVTAPIAGRVRTVRVTRGARVSQGDILVELDAGSLQRDVRRRALAVERARVSLTQSVRNGPRDRLKEIELQQAMIDYEDATARSREAFVRSPLAGVVVHLAVAAGDFVTSNSTSIGTQIAVVADISSYVVEIEADEGEVASLAAGQPALVSLKSRSAPLAGRLRDDPVLRRLAQGRVSSASYGVSVTVLDTPERPAFGESVRVEVAAKSRTQVTIVPLTAVFEFSGSHYILNTSGPRPTPTKVVVGLCDDNFAEIVSGVTAGTSVAVGSSEQLRRAAFGRAAVGG
jgi:multidrug efflux pump subunit AcrA (membrane-fusion protein)